MIGIDRKTITSVGIDVGTTTSHLVFSELVLEKDPLSRSKKFHIVEREVKHRGSIFFTPLKDGNQGIDVNRLLPLLRQEYERAGIDISKVDTGAVIVTGESARKENAEEIVERIARESGKFVAATAGPNFEAFISAYGSGAVEYSARESCKLIHADVGGGTSKVAVIDNGQILSTGCVNVGGRLIAFGDQGEIVRLEPAGMQVLDELGLDIVPGDILPEEIKGRVADTLASSLVEVISGLPYSSLTRRLMLTKPLPAESLQGDTLHSFSGGVAEYVYGRERRDFKDLGRLLGEKIRALCVESSLRLVEPPEKIRATVIGASEFTLQVTGSTTYREPGFALPIRNLPVAAPAIKRDKLSVEHVSSQIAKALARLDIRQREVSIALAFHDPVGPEYERLKTFSLGLAEAVRETVESGQPIILVFDTDIGNSVGNVLHRETRTRNVLSIDEISLDEGDFIDIGEPIIGDPVYPVVVKSLVFESFGL
ncbi:MAG: ethanolamine ammonia-lyase reactivating factor EutA [Candidatus Bathyarchaeota archaeon]|nr:ethanolamine ammonia-lyase reactivating factor EutA [Candidatus Bathyarchaeota archaeon]